MSLSSIYVWACLFVTLGFGAIGFLDDYDKVTKASHKGLSGKMRLAFEFLIAGFAAWLIVSQHGNTALYVPRSEEHTSELQSLMRISYAVFCLKKKKS